MCDSTPKPGEPLLDNMAVLLSGRASFELVEFSAASFLNVNTPADLKAAGRRTATMEAHGSGCDRYCRRVLLWRLVGRRYRRDGWRSRQTRTLDALVVGGWWERFRGESHQRAPARRQSRSGCAHAGLPRRHSAELANDSEDENELVHDTRRSGGAPFVALGVSHCATLKRLELGSPTAPPAPDSRGSRCRSALAFRLPTAASRRFPAVR